MNFRPVFFAFVISLTFFACQNDSNKTATTAPEKTAPLDPLAPPDQIYGDLFKAIQMAKIYPDGKTFPDCTPKMAVSEILKNYAASKDKPDFDLKNFAEQHFTPPPKNETGYQTDMSQDVAKHINDLWPVLTRNPQNVTNSSLLALPKSYVVPGGRFREIYYWDSFFTMLGLRASGRQDLIENMVENFAHLINQYGHIPNGNRTYYLSRSQPPFFSLMVRLLDELNASKPTADRPLVRFLPEMEKEWAFWDDQANVFQKENIAAPAARRRVVQLDGGQLHRYFDDSETPRAESYKEDVETAAAAPNRPAAEVYKNLKAAAESGWDFSSRWLADGKTLSTIRTIEILPVDLNCLLYHLERTIGEAYQIKGDFDKATAWIRSAHLRAELISETFWNPKDQFFEDFDWKNNRPTGVKSLAGVYPLYFGLATPEQSAAVAKILKKDFLQAGGLLTTLTQTGQQWDAPNSWAPLQWLAVRGLEKNGQKTLAADIKSRWIDLNTAVYKRTGKLMEKYHVDKTGEDAGGGEYPVQDGFGWTNGVLLDFLKN